MEIANNFTEADIAILASRGQHPAEYSLPATVLLSPRFNVPIKSICYEIISFLLKKSYIFEHYKT